MGKKRRARQTGASGAASASLEIPPDKQNQQLEEAAVTADRRRKSRYGQKDLGSKQVLPGKKFDEWTWRSPEGDEIAIPVRVVKERGVRCEEAGNRLVESDTAKAYFQVVMPEYALNEFDTDIERLRQKVFKAIEVPFQIVWEPYLLVEIEGRDHPVKARNWRAWGARKPSDKQTRFEDLDAGKLAGDVEIKVSVEEWDLGKTKGGRKVSRKQRGSQAGRIRKEWPEQAAEAESYDGYHTRSLLRATPENKAALELLIKGLSMFRDRLDKLLHPDNAQEAFQVAASRLAVAITGPKEKG